MALYVEGKRTDNRLFIVTGQILSTLTIIREENKHVPEKEILWKTEEV